MSQLLVLLTCLLSGVSAQWIYPPPLPDGATLTDFTTGALSPITDFVIHDSMIASYSTPDGGYGLARCAKPGRTEPIYPSNGTFTSEKGRLADDGTWEFMSIYINANGNRIGRGNNIWYEMSFEDYVESETMGRKICWLELYEGREERDVKTDCASAGCTQEFTQVITVDGSDKANYFASTPFVVQTTMREGRQNQSWSSGDHSSSDATITIHIGSEPTGNAAGETEINGGGLLSALLSVLTMVLAMAA